MSIIDKKMLEIYESDRDYIKYENRRAKFNTKFVNEMKHNGEIIDVLGLRKGKDIYNDRYVVQFNDGIIEDNVMSIELEFDYIKENKIKQKVEDYIKNTEEYAKFKIEYVLSDKDNKIKGIAFYNDEIIEIDYSNRKIKGVADWAYNIDEDIFGELESNKKIEYMSINMHFNIWETIKQWYPEDIENKKGMQKYLKYCKDNKITKKIIEQETKLNDVPDIMQYYEKRRKVKDER